MAVLATPEDLIARRDERTVGQILVDDEDVVLTHDEILEHPKLLTLLSASAGKVRAALLCGERYKPEQLESLTGDDREFLVDIICMLVMARLWERRPGLHDEQIKNLNGQAELYLEQLRQGKNLFNLSTHRVVANPTIGGPTVVDLVNTNTISTQCMGRHFPSQDQFLPRDRG